MRDEVFRELSDGARQQQRAQKLVLEQPAEHIFKAGRPGRISVIGNRAHANAEAERYRASEQSKEYPCVSDNIRDAGFYF